MRNGLRSQSLDCSVLNTFKCVTLSKKEKEKQYIYLRLHIERRINCKLCTSMCGNGFILSSSSKMSF